MNQVATRRALKKIDVEEALEEAKALSDKIGRMNSALRHIVDYGYGYCSSSHKELERIEKALEEYQSSGAALLPERLIGLFREIGGPVEGAPPASKAEVSKHIALLIGSFPSANVPEPKVYTTMMVEDVTAAKPSPLGLSLACSRVRKTSTFMPAIAEVLSAIRMEEMYLSMYLNVGSSLLKCAKELAERKQLLVQSIEEKKRLHEAKKAAVRKLILEGEFILREYSTDLVREVKADLKREGIERPLAPWEKEFTEREWDRWD